MLFLMLKGYSRGIMLQKSYNFCLKCLIIIIIALFYLLICFVWNNYQIKPSLVEKKTLKSYLGKSIIITSEKDLIFIQNKVINDIRSGKNNHSPIDIIKVLKYRKGLCFHRSLLLQKILLINNIDVRPVFMYIRKDGRNTILLDLFTKDIYTHNLFEFKWNGKWYLMLTNQRMLELKPINYYSRIDNVPKGFQYLRHVNNRNGCFIFPSYLIDIY